MPRKSPDAAILDALKSLKNDQFEEFCHKLTHSEEEPKFNVSEVHDKRRYEISAVIVSRCSSKAVDRTIKTLKEIGCIKEAETLASDTEDPSRPKRERSRTPPGHFPSAAGASGGPASGEGHFVDRHQIQLIKRVSNINPILDYLLKEKVLRPEQYDKAMDIRPKQDQMRFLYSGPLTAGGESSKDVLLTVLEEEEPYLVQDLRESEG